MSYKESLSRSSLAGATLARLFLQMANEKEHKKLETTNKKYGNVVKYKKHKVLGKKLWLK